MKKWIEEVIRSPHRVAVPIMTHPGIEMIGKQVVDACKDGQIHFEAIQALDKTWPAAATTVIMDLTVEAEAFGANIIFPTEEVPSVTGRLLSNKAEVEALPIPSVDAGRIHEYLKANQLTAESIQDKPVLGGCIGPFSLAGRLFDMTEIMMAIYIEPETVELLLEKCTTFLLSYLQALKKTSIDGVMMAEPAAGLLSNKDCLAYSSRYIQTIVDAVQDESFSVILHNCGNKGHCTDAMIATGAAAYHFGNKAYMVEALQKCPENTLVMGNIDPVSVMKQSSPEEVEQAVNKLLIETAPYANFVLSTGCDTPPQIPLKNIEAFYQALDRYNTKM
ncbi:uroporphyrinogen decarboxylase [Parabacteroides sp. PF5-5]|uniref:uroporphyrinogen decarboxylase family protein n=1 Tax=unclassified Parabacteroides TaxID=2649774 RepID=UPI002476176A|nr:MULTISPECIES: uroporphyrinogen decarboxylase family protein [unclassified Parabacteroides]MDH6305437.1 uroporphyrinogen decarboxylase [Parabacteroides sp. PH5-39]MDH6316147.1 uroporphyrinogen decarboxylase [Parabacteroides sp. PF5-13]MDH6320297.1 uroporphyrinogen decarboxylase [Parabacteroides sp. PH5-13]MDH6324027.1 uroporphyrinogen decarboxylase [Parabacteroides sp. PH5-8]MDH6327338.1 uroporphyrinogen decarboxylase [Parabacteroides sp. PH5-41]